GFTALVTALCFIVAMFLSPIAKLIPSCATATALIWVGVLMMSAVTTIDWNDAADAIVGFMTFIVMVLGYSISKGIGMGIITFIIIKLFTGKVKDISIVTWVIGALFVATFLVSSM
ncbi:MAG: solute carrier family 23 protein, partial [Candidatus Coproplasma sp.]